MSQTEQRKIAHLRNSLEAIAKYEFEQRFDLLLKDSASDPLETVSRAIELAQANTHWFTESIPVLDKLVAEGLEARRAKNEERLWKQGDEQMYAVVSQAIDGCEARYKKAMKELKALKKDPFRREVYFEDLWEEIRFYAEWSVMVVDSDVHEE
ncbi:hypothetical protein BJ508DRAFT_329231 [Ascobolus immersus RN42]|uniref:Uncharacterized protein n=1 Tax=Ascobolus immersus RN42 TaxID=1160509 RepID=A0A3N4HX86_ASCIM|nr:hypothetical protein BJ508DRAFT_329231 [Ascobolus immersus RN42]